MTCIRLIPMKPDLKQVRKALGLTIAQLAYQAGVSGALVWSLENDRLNKEKMQSRTRTALSAAYGVDLITGEPLDEVTEVASAQG